MRLLINAIPLLGERTGVGNYTRQIASGAFMDSANFHCDFFYGYYSGKLLGGEDGREESWPGELKKLARRWRMIGKICKKIMLVSNRAWQFVQSTPYDCYFEPNFILLPGVRAKRFILTAHDFSCFLYPHWHPAERTRHMEKHFWKSAEKADKIITVSESIRRQAIEIFGMEPSRVVAIPNGVDHSFYKPAAAEKIAGIRAKYSLPPQYLLYVGALEPRKNLRNLLAAHASLPEAVKRNFPLILAGSQGWKNSDIMELLEKCAPSARMLGYVPQKDLPPLYSAASLFVYPSWYEGFGLPVLEAMACGCPALASDDASLVELCGGAAQHSRGESDALRQSLLELLPDEEKRRALAQKALRRAADFSWRKSVDAHLRLFMDGA